MLSEFSSFIFLFVAVVVLVWSFAFAYLLFLFEDNVSCNPWFECSKLLRMSFNFCPPASTSQILALQVYATTPMDPFFFSFLDQRTQPHNSSRGWQDNLDPESHHGPTVVRAACRWILHTRSQAGGEEDRIRCRHPVWCPGTSVQSWVTASTWKGRLPSGAV